MARWPRTSRTSSRSRADGDVRHRYARPACMLLRAGEGREGAGLRSRVHSGSMTATSRRSTAIRDPHVVSVGAPAIAILITCDQLSPVTVHDRQHPFLHDAMHLIGQRIAELIVDEPSKLVRPFRLG